MLVLLRRAGLGTALLLALTMLGGQHAVAATPQPAPGVLDSFVEEQMERADIPGVAYAVVGPAGVEHQRTLGVDGEGRPVTERTAFVWGSVAKPVTATLIVLLADAGELDLDAPLTTYLPDFRMAEDAARRITVRHLLSQTGGIPGRMDLTDRYDADRRPGDLVSGLSDVGLESAVGKEHVYSSLNYVLLGAVAEAVTGQSFADTLSRYVLEPAGMDTAITTVEQFEQRMPPGHRYVLGGTRAFDTGFDPAGLSSGYLGGTLDDAIAFARANLTGSTLLDDEQRAALVEPQVRTGDDRTYGLGWRTWPVPGTDAQMTWHAGAAPGYQASIVLLPEQDRAVVVLQNAYGSFQGPQLLDTAWGLATLLSGGEPELHPVDPLYVVVLAGLGAVCLALLGLIGWSARRSVRPGPTGSRRRALLGLAAWLAGTAVVATALAYLPGSFGVTMGQISLWAPDIAALVYTGLVLSGLLALARVVVTIRGQRSPETPATIRSASAR